VYYWREYYTKITGLDFLLTYRCTAECKHCSYRASPNRKGVIEVKDANNYLKQIVSISDLKGITVHGGEPFLYYEGLKEIIKKAKNLKIPARGVITNSYWATSEKKTREMLEELKKVGLNQITLSGDSFHQEFIPVANIKRSIKIAAEIGIREIWVDSYYLEGKEEINSYNTRTNEILAELYRMKNLVNVEFNAYPLSFTGRASTLTNNAKKMKTEDLTECNLPYWIGGSLADPETIEIDCEGNVTLCPGISIGNAKKESIIEILENYDVYAHPILSRLHEGGLLNLLELAEEKGFVKEKYYMDNCHFCYEMRKFLRPFYQDYLSPMGCYYGIF